MVTKLFLFQLDELGLANIYLVCVGAVYLGFCYLHKLVGLRNSTDSNFLLKGLLKARDSLRSLSEIEASKMRVLNLLLLHTLWSSLRKYLPEIQEAVLSSKVFTKIMENKMRNGSSRLRVKIWPIPISQLDLKLKFFIQ